MLDEDCDEDEAAAGGNWYLKIPFDFEEQLKTGLWKMSQPAKLAKLGTGTGSLEKI